MGKNQHYVPQFLLRKFSLPGSKEKAIELLNLKTGRFHSPARIRNQCAQDYFYGKDQSTEDILSKLETNTSKVIRGALASQRTPDRGTFDWRTMVDFIAIQHGRTPAAVKETNSLATAMVRGILHAGALRSEIDLAASMIDKIRLTHKRGPLPTIEEAVDLSPKLWDLQDLLVINECNAGFALPDIGIIFHNEWAREAQGWGVTGYCCHGLQILLPLSPRVLWIKYDPDVYRIPQDLTAIPTHEIDDIIKFNRLAVSHSENSVYFAGDAPTRAMLSTIKSELRAPRSESVRSKKPTQIANELTIAAYYELPNVEFNVSWMALSPEAAQVPVSQRVGMYRASSEEMPTYSEYRRGKRPPSDDEE